MRIGLVGVGRIGAVHARTLTGLDAVDQLVIADQDQQRAKALAGTLDAAPDRVQVATDAAALLASRPDGVVIAASTAAHTELLHAAVAAGVPAFCEKPVASNITATVAVRDAVVAADVLVQMGFQRRFDAGHVAARAAVAGGALGWLHSVRSQTCDPAPPPAAYIATSGGIFRDCCVHDFDAIRWVTGREVVEVYATGSNRGEAFFAESGDVATASALLTLDDGTLATVTATRYNAAGYDVRFEALGSAGSFAAGLDSSTPIQTAPAAGGWPDGPAYRTFADRFAGAYAAELATFVDLIAAAGETPCSVEDALQATYLAEAAELSREQRRPVRVAEVIGVPA